MAHPRAPIPSPSTQYFSQDEHAHASGLIDACYHGDAATLDAFGSAICANGLSHEHHLPYLPGLPFDRELVDNFLGTQVPLVRSLHEPGSMLEPSAAYLPSAHDHYNGQHVPWGALATEATQSAHFNAPALDAATLDVFVMPSTLSPVTSTAVTTHRTGFSSTYSEIASALSYSRETPVFVQGPPSYTQNISQQGPDLSISSPLPAQPIHTASPAVSTRRAHAAEASHSGTEHTPSSSYSAPPSSRDSRSPATCSRPRRNSPVSVSSPPPPSDPTHKLKCPHCPYVQCNDRGQELRRHIQTHTRPTDPTEAFWKCCGVPLADAVDAGVPFEALTETPLEYNGILFVGGCGVDFSRKDALTRHLRRFKGVCYGHQNGAYLRGNQEGAR